MMQMLAAGGLPIVSDGERAPDADNPRGYCEFERIKLLPQEPACIDEAEGKAVKVISQLLFALPVGHDYRTIFMDRRLPEVVASQAEMIRRRGTTGATVPEAALIAGLKMHLNQVNAWLAHRRAILVHHVDYHLVLRDPKAAAENISKFLEMELDVDSMAREVDLNLYRQRK